MTATDVILIVPILLGFAILRFGVPMLLMWLIKLGCCRILHVKPQ